MEVVRTSADWVLYIRDGLVISREVLARLDRLLQPFEYREPSGHLYSYTEASSALGVSLSWLRRRVSRGEVPYHAVGNYIRFTGSDIEEIRKQMGRVPGPGGS